MKHPFFSVRGFNLPELIGVVVILGIISGVALSVSSGMVEESRKQTAISNAQAMNAAKQSYRNRVPGADAEWAAKANDEARYQLLRDPDADGDLVDSYLPFSGSTLVDYMPTGYSLTMNKLYEKCGISGPTGAVAY